MDYIIQKSERHVKQNNLLVAKGIIAIVWGIAAVTCSFFIPTFLIVSFGILNFVAAALTLTYAFNNRHLEIAHQWLLLEGIVELVAGIVFTFAVKSVAQFISYMSFGIIFIITLQFIVVGLFSILYGSLNMQFASKLRNVIMGHVE